MPRFRLPSAFVSHSFGRLLAIAALIVLSAAPAVRAQSGGLISETVARRHGLTRGWYAQVEVNQATDNLAHLTLHGGTLFVQTTAGMVHALDAETGRAMWVAQIGRRDRYNVAPGANAKYVAVVNGTILYLADRMDGHIVWSRKLRGSPGAGPVVTDKQVFVPMVSGMLEGYELANKGNQTPWIYQSKGRIFGQPVITAQTVGWTTDQGTLYVANANPMKIRARMQTAAVIESRPAYWTPNFFVASIDGFVYAVDEKTAEIAWKFSSGDPVTQPPVAVNNRVYVESETGGMFCLDGSKGTEKWMSPRITRFISISPTRIYTLDEMRQLVILDAASGARLDTLPIASTVTPLLNEQTDRIYLSSASGVIQCLHEASLAKPTIYTPPPLPESSQPGAKKKEKESDKEKAKADEPADDEKPADDAKMGDKKAGDAMPEDDPFK